MDEDYTLSDHLFDMIANLQILKKAIDSGEEPAPHFIQEIDEFWEDIKEEINE